MHLNVKLIMNFGIVMNELWRKTLVGNIFH